MYSRDYRVWDDLYSTAHPGFTVSGAGSGQGVNLVRIQLTGSNGGATNTMIWNGDPSSHIIDTEITTDAPQNAASVNPVIIVQSGGLYYDECDPGVSDTNGNGAKTWMEYNAQGPTYLVGCNIEHQAGPTLVIHNGANLRIEQMEHEFDVPSCSHHWRTCSFSKANFRFRAPGICWKT
jgi:hypothetical protein